MPSARLAVSAGATTRTPPSSRQKLRQKPPCACAWKSSRIVRRRSADGAGIAGIAGFAALLQGALAEPGLRAAAGGLQAALLQLAALPLATFVVLFFAWCAGFERSALRATPGKRALGLRVTSVDGDRPGDGQLLLRFLAGTLSWLSLNIGHMMAALPPSFTTLHDRISRTRVYRDAGTAARLPAWAGAWLAMLGAAMLLAGAWLAIAMSAGLQAALERALPGYG